MDLGEVLRFACSLDPLAVSTLLEPAEVPQPAEGEGHNLCEWFRGDEGNLALESRRQGVAEPGSSKALLGRLLLHDQAPVH